jgi:hypothetical protein
MSDLQVRPPNKIARLPSVRGRYLESIFRWRKTSGWDRKPKDAFRAVLNRSPLVWAMTRQYMLRVKQRSRKRFAQIDNVGPDRSP